MTSSSTDSVKDLSPVERIVTYFVEKVLGR